MNTKPKAYSYIRFSTPDQARGDSYRRQRDAAERFCEVEGLEFASSKEYLFFDQGRSAFKAAHVADAAELARFLRYVEDGAIEAGSYLIVESLDRLSRERIKDALPRFLDLLNRGIKIYTSADQRLYTENYSELELIMSIVQMSRAHEESALKSKRITAAWKQKRERAIDQHVPMGGACPSWLICCGDRYEPIHERVKVISMIFQLSLEGHGQRAIVRILNEKAVPAFGSINRNPTGTWSHSSCRRILTNRALIGEYQPTAILDGSRRPVGQPIVGYYPTIVAVDDFHAVQAAITKRKSTAATNPGKSFNVWQGVAKCLTCGQAMHILDKGKSKSGAKYLRCYGAAKGLCKALSVRLDHSEVVFKEILAKMSALSLVQAFPAELEKKMRSLDGQIEEISDRLNSLEKQALAFQEQMPTTFLKTVSALEVKLNECKTERSAIADELGKQNVLTKSEFLERLDLSSFASRSKANYWLKSLDVTVLIDKADLVRYLVLVAGEKAMSISVRDKSSSFTPYKREYLDTINMHGDADVLTSIGEIFIGSDEINKGTLRLISDMEELERLKSLPVQDL